MSADLRYLRTVISHPDPVVTAVEVAAELDVSQQAAHAKLSDLESEGLVRSKTTGAKSRVWWATTAGHDRYRKSQ